MNIVKLQDQLKNFSQDQLVREMQAPSGNAPQFLVLGEIMRRKRMQDDFTAQNAKDDEGTVAQEAVAAAGVPQGGIADMARALAPSTDMTQNTGVKAMYAGGPVKKMAAGDVVVLGGKQYTEQQDGTYLGKDGSAPSEVDKARAKGQESFTPLDILSGYGITFGGGGAKPGLAVPGPGRTPVVASEVAETMGPGMPTEEQFATMRAEEEARRAAEEAPPEAPKDTTAGGGGGGGMSSYEQELMDALGRREKAAQQDKWLSLAQVGLNLMSSTNPTIGGAIGEAGLKGVEAARGARDQYDKDRLELLGAVEQSRAARAKAAAKGSGGIKPLNAGGIMAQQKYMLDLAESQLDRLTGGQSPEQAMAMLTEAAQDGDVMAATQLTALDGAIKQYSSAYNNYMSAAGQLGALTMSEPGAGADTPDFSDPD